MKEIFVVKNGEGLWLNREAQFTGSVASAIHYKSYADATGGIDALPGTGFYQVEKYFVKEATQLNHSGEKEQ